MSRKLNSSDIEYAVAIFMNPRINIIVPNVYWGLGLSYEADMIIVSPSLYCTEVEIKVSKADIKADLNKSYYAHKGLIIKKFFYAVPDYLQDCEYLPRDCGLITVDKNLVCKTIREPRNQITRKLRPDEVNKLLHLGCMRIWTLKDALRRKRNEKEELINQ